MIPAEEGGAGGGAADLNTPEGPATSTAEELKAQMVAKYGQETVDAISAENDTSEWTEDDWEYYIWLYRNIEDEDKPEGEEDSGESGSKTATTIDYSYKFDRELANFNDGYEIRTTVDKDLILVQYSSDAPDASLCYWTTVDEANGITTLNDYMDKLGLSKDWGNRNTVKVARIPAGTEVKYAVGTAREQLLIADPRPGGGVQYLFNQFDTDWITEIRSFSN